MDLKSVKLGSRSDERAQDIPSLSTSNPVCAAQHFETAGPGVFEPAGFYIPHDPKKWLPVFRFSHAAT